MLFSYDFQILVLYTSLYNFGLIFAHKYFTLKNYVSFFIPLQQISLAKIFSLNNYLPNAFSEPIVFLRDI